MIGPCRDCPNHKEPPLDPPEASDEHMDTEEIREIKAQEKLDERMGK